MDKEFVPYEQALELKELGFDEPCIMAYIGKDKQLYSNCDDFLHLNAIDVLNPLKAPTFSQAFRFFREKYNLRGFIGFRPNVKQFDCHVYDMSLSGEEYVKQRTMEEYNKDPKVGTYEEAELACLIKLIQIIKDGNK